MSQRKKTTGKPRDREDDEVCNNTTKLLNSIHWCGSWYDTGVTGRRKRESHGQEMSQTATASGLQPSDKQF